jgi:starch-binding outer membrane protein SusE/F
MKNIFKTTIFAIFLIALGSCENETHLAVEPNGFTLGPLQPSGPYVLSPANGDNDVVNLIWGTSDIGVETIASNYVVEIAKSGTNFAAPIIASPNSTVKSFLWKEGYLNGLLIENGFLPDVAADLDVRVKAVLGLGSNPFTQYSNVVAIKVTPFAQSAFAFTKEGQDPGVAPKTLSSGFFNSDTEGYAWIEPGNYKFYASVQNKFQSSNPAYGNNGSGGLVLNGSAINVTTAGYYLIKADIGVTPTTYSLTPISAFGIIGDAKVFGSLNSLPPMTYDRADNKWKITISLKGAKGFKFRANNSDVINLGAGNAGAGSPNYAGTLMQYNGTPIKVPGLSTVTLPYAVTLDLSKPRDYKFTMVAQ